MLDDVEAGLAAEVRSKRRDRIRVRVRVGGRVRVRIRVRVRPGARVQHTGVRRLKVMARVKVGSERNSC